MVSPSTPNGTSKSHHNLFEESREDSLVSFGEFNVYGWLVMKEKSSSFP